MGLEGKESQYAKLAGADTRELVRTLQSHGISILGSTIIGLEEHTPQNLPEAIEYAVSHETEFHQFMLYTPVPGTPLFEEHREAGTLLDPEGKQLADAHGQLKFMRNQKGVWSQGATCVGLWRDMGLPFPEGGSATPRCRVYPRAPHVPRE